MLFKGSHLNTREGIEVEVSVDKAVQIGQKTYTATVTQRQPSLESAPKPRNPGLLSGALLKRQGKFATLVWVQTEVHPDMLYA